MSQGNKHPDDPAVPEPAKSLTPRTNALAYYLSHDPAGQNKPWGDTMAEHARQLERELAERAHTYLVRDGYEWARFFILEGDRRSGDGQWGYVSIISDFGNFGAFFSNVGGRSFRSFLAGLEFTYAMEKLRPRDHRMQFDFDASIKKAKRHVFKARRGRTLTDSGARRVYEEIQEIVAEGRMGSERFGYMLMDAFSGYPGLWDDYDSCVERYSPECAGLWKLWPKLVEQFRADGAL